MSICSHPSRGRAISPARLGLSPWAAIPAVTGVLRGAA